MNDQKKKQYLPLILIAYVFAFFIITSASGVPTDIRSITNFIGFGFGLAIIPLIVMRFAGNAASIIILLVMCSSIFLDQTDLLDDSQKAVDKSMKPVVFVAKDCEYSVTFPSKPAIQIYTNPAIGDYEEAIWSVREQSESISLKSECFKVPNLTSRIDGSPKKFILNQLSIYATNNGLSAPEYQYKKLSIGEGGMLRGSKLVEGVPVTYEMVMVVGVNSIIMMKAGGTSATYPQKVISPFLTSVTLVAQGNTQ